MEPIYHQTIETLRLDKDNQRALFAAMIRRLEDASACRYIFHDLAEVLGFDNL